MVLPTIGAPVPGYYFDSATNTLRPIVGQGPPGNANVTVSPNAPTGGKYGDLWVQTTVAPWVAPSTLPAGIVAYKNWGLNLSVVVGTTPTVLATFTNVAVKAGRLYRYNFHSRACGVAGTTPGSIKIHTTSSSPIAGTDLGFEVWVYCPGAGGGWSSVIVDQLFTVTADMNLTFNILATGPVAGCTVYTTNMVIEDIGPNRGFQP
jgi:hypothetical protein